METIMWLYNNNEYKLPDDFKLTKPDYYGFVYLITNKLDGRKYIGKKFFISIKRKQVNKKSKRVKVESNWQDYYGSSESVKADVESLGKENFHREIIHLCRTKSECGFLEAHEQFARQVLLTDEYYNDWISCRVKRSHLKKHAHLLNEQLT